MNIIWHGTASIEIECNKNKILFDPYIGINNDLGLLNKYLKINNIFITHNHLDHISSIKYIFNKNNNVKIYSTDCGIKSLIKDNIDINNLNKINFHDKYIINNIGVEVLKGKHIRFNIKLILKTLFNKKVIKYFYNLKQIIIDNFKYRESGECVCFKIINDCCNILVMGSMDLDKNEDYNNIDVLVMAYQGRTDLCKRSIKIIDKIHPKLIILTHFDDTFPPISSLVDYDDFINLVNKRYPQIKLVIPKKEEKIDIKSLL